MKKSDIDLMPEYFDRYINLVEDTELNTAFKKSIEEITALDMALLYKIGKQTYQPEKWSINEIILHITDTERLLTAGVLRFSRGESDYIIHFDENEVARNSKANNREIKELIQELLTVRQATISLYKSFDTEDFLKTGINWKYRISILAMGFNIIGHQIHHFNFIQSHYYPLIQKIQ